MPTVEELYRNYGILADATEQVGQVSPRAACRALRSAAFRERSRGRAGPGGVGGEGPRCAVPRVPGGPGCFAAVGPGLGVRTRRPRSASLGQPVLPVAPSSSASR